MIVAHHMPRAPLSDFVKVLWYWDGYVQPHSQERLLPDGSMCIVFNLGEDRIRLPDAEDASRSNTIAGQVLCGARSRYLIANTDDMVTTLGIQFKAGGAFPFLAMPASELNEQCVSLGAVLGDGVRGLRDRLLEGSTPAQKFDVIERWLLSCVTKPLRRHAAVEYATSRFLSGGPNQSLASVLDRIGYSQRHFNQMFTEEVGLTPKRFLRVVRFQRVIATVAPRTSVNWSELALGCGYYDQAHFTHDFRAFSGLTPATYLLHRTPHLNHVPV